MKYAIYTGITVIGNCSGIAIWSLEYLQYIQAPLPYEEVLDNTNTHTLHTYNCIIRQR